MFFLLPSLPCSVVPMCRYDAVGLRLHTGRQATALNAVVVELLPEDHAVAPGNFGRLRESLGHTPAEVRV